MKNDLIFVALSIIIFIILFVLGFSLLLIYFGKDIANSFIVIVGIIIVGILRPFKFTHRKIEFTKKEGEIMDKTDDYLVKKYGLAEVENGNFVQEGGLRVGSDIFGMIYKDIKNRRKIIIAYNKKSGEIKEEIYDGSKDGLIIR